MDFIAYVEFSLQCCIATEQAMYVSFPSKKKKKKKKKRKKNENLMSLDAVTLSELID